MESTESTERHWLTAREACRRLGLEVRAVYQLIDEDRLPAYKHGRDLRLNAADVEAYRAQHPPSTS